MTNSLSLLGHASGHSGTTAAQSCLRRKESLRTPQPDASIKQVETEAQLCVQCTIRRGSRYVNFKPQPNCSASTTSSNFRHGGAAGARSQARQRGGGSGSSVKHPQLGRPNCVHAQRACPASFFGPRPLRILSLKLGASGLSARSGCARLIGRDAGVVKRWAAVARPASSN